MKRMTISLDDALADAVDALVHQRGYSNRSEAFRDLLREELGEARRAEQPAGPCVATLTYLYAHQRRQLTTRLKHLQQEQHELTVAALQSLLDHDHCIETVILRGPSDRVQAFADSVLAQPGVTHGHLHLVPMAQQKKADHEHLAPLAAAGVPRRRSQRTAP